MKTKTLKLIAILLFIASMAQAQGVAIGDKDFTPNAAAILDVQSQNKGMLVPRMSYTERMYIPTNAQSTGLLVYQTDREAGFYYWDGLVWKYLAPPQNVELPNFATVALSGNYEDLKNKPEIPTSLTLSKVATSGDYSDLQNTPAIPTRLRDLEQDEYYFTTVSRAERDGWNAKSNFSGSYKDLSDKPTFSVGENGELNLAQVALTGDYNDLTNKPRLQDLQQDEYYFTTVTKAERDKWNGAAEGHSISYNDLLNKPDLARVATSGDYTDLQNRPTIPVMLRDLQTDYNNLTVTELEKQRWDAKSNFSGNYDDLSNKPNIPTKISQLEDDAYHRTVSDVDRISWNAKSTFSGSYTDLSDRPNIPIAAQTGSYTDLTNKPFIPSKLSDLDDATNFRTVTDVQITKWDAKSNFSGNYSDLNGLPDIADMVKTAINARLPIGSVIMWVGTPQTVPSGWRIMSEMIGRFPVGAGTATGSGGVTRSYAVNENQDASGESGQEFVTLTEPQIPSHNHGTGNYGRDTQSGFYLGGSGNFTVNNSTDNAGGGGAHENRPPFRALYFIEKVSE